MPVVGRQQRSSVFAVSVEDPSAEEQRSPLVPLREPLRPSYPARERRSSDEGILDRRDGVERPLDSIQFVGLVEPLVMLSNGAVDR